MGVLMLAACTPKPDPERTTEMKHDAVVLLRVGSVEVRESDLERHLDDLHAGRRDPSTRQKALDELAKTAQLVMVAFESQLENDPVVRAEIARVLANRVKERTLYPELKRLATEVPETRLRELYGANKADYQSNEKRQVAVLWLDPGKDPQRAVQYQEKLEAARSWFLESSELKAHPERGFAELGVDYSEHQASRYKGGVVGWLEREGNSDALTQAVAEIAYTLNKPGEVSAVTARPEGLFLVRYMALAPAVLRPFEAVVSDLKRMETSRLKKQVETAFWNDMAAKYPIERVTEPTMESPVAQPPMAN
jgi:hypothetical protein